MIGNLRSKYWVHDCCNMKSIKIVNTPLGSHFKFKQSNPSENEKEKMNSVLYSLAVENLTYATLWSTEESRCSILPLKWFVDTLPVQARSICKW